MKKSFILYIIFFLVFFVTSCVSDFDFFDVSTDVLIDESLVFPVAEGTVSVQDLLKKLGLPDYLDTTNSQISYVDSFKLVLSYDKLEQADTIKPFQKLLYLSAEPLSIPAFYPLNPFSFNADIEMTVNENISKEYVDSVIINSAKLKIIVEVSPDLQNISPSDLSVEFLFSDDVMKFYTQTNLLFQDLEYGVPSYKTVQGFKISLNKSSLIPLDIKVYLKTQSSPINITPDSYVKVRMDFVDVDLSRVYGKFNVDLTDSYTYDTKVNLDSFIPNSFIQLSNPKLDFSVTSNVGIDLKLDVNHLKSFNSGTPANEFEAVFINPATGTSSTSFSDTFIGPQLYGDWVTKKFDEFNNVNGEFDKVFDKKPYPNMLKWDVAMSAIASRTSSFISVDNKTKLKLKVTIPLQFKEDSYFTLTDTIKDIDVGKMLDAVDSAILVLKLKNGFPLRAKYRMTFWKSNLANDTISAFGGSINSVSDDSESGNLTSQYIITSANVNDDGFVSEVVPQYIKIILNKPQIDALKQTKFIVFSLYLTGDKKDILGTMTSYPISLTTKNNFDVKLGLFIKGNTVVDILNN
ncbi:MAG: hypothetical protein PHS59_04460 [Paludibacter sp.]|nr:hypothetical protein [Paludibacter sp.]